MLYESFSEFQELLTQRLGKPLPGRAAQFRMAADSYRAVVQPDPAFRGPAIRGTAFRESAVLVLFYPYQQTVYFPLILRPQYDGVHSGQMAFPGGRFEQTDRDLVHTALREAEEEIGIRETDVTILGRLSEIYVPASNTNVQPVIGIMPFRPVYVPDPREVAQVYEVQLEKIQDRGILKEGKMPVRGGFIRAPYYELDTQRIWGATAMMISELLEILEP